MVNWDKTKVAIAKEILHHQRAFKTGDNKTKFYDRRIGTFNPHALYQYLLRNNLLEYWEYQPRTFRKFSE